jgi:ABC-type multidrug transport system permease subunit
VRHAWYIATKELLENRRDGLAALFTIVLPVIFTIFLGLIIGSAERGGLPLAVADADDSPEAQQLISRLDESQLLELEIMGAEEVDGAVHDQKVAAGLVIPQGYGTGLRSGQPVALTFVRVQTSTGAQTVRQAVENVVSRLNISMKAARTAAEQVSSATGMPLDDTLLASARLLSDAQLATPAATVSLADSSTSTKQTAGGFDQSSSGSLVNWVLFSLIGVTTTMVWERRRGLLRRLSIAGISGAEIIGGKMLAMLIITFAQQLLLVILGQFAFDVDYFNSPVALIVTMISLSMLAASFGLLICVAFRSEQAVIATTVISAQLLAALGGAWFPLEITSAGFAKVAHVLPSAWIMDSLHGIILKDWGVSQILCPMGIVWIWIIVLFGLAVWRYRPD